MLNNVFWRFSIDAVLLFNHFHYCKVYFMTLQKKNVSIQFLMDLGIYLLLSVTKNCAMDILVHMQYFLQVLFQLGLVSAMSDRNPK